MIHRFLSWFSSFLAVHAITRGWNGTPYMERYIFRRRGAAFPRRNWGVYLHHFVDDDTCELHNHPFHAVSLILSGGYTEMRLHAFGVALRQYTAGQVNILSPSTFHRVDLLTDKKDTWTLFFYWQRGGSWGFLNRFTNRYLDWEEHRRQASRGVPS